MRGKLKKTVRKPKPSEEKVWDKLPELPFEIGRRTSLSRGPNGEDHFWLNFMRRVKDSSLIGNFVAGKTAEGPPGHIHGGVSALILDEAMGASVWIRGVPAVAKELKFRYLRMAPSNEMLWVEAEITSIKGKTIRVRSRIFSWENKKRVELVRGEGIFHRLSERAVREIARKAGVTAPASLVPASTRTRARA